MSTLDYAFEMLKDKLLQAVKNRKQYYIKRNQYANTTDYTIFLACYHHYDGKVHAYKQAIRYTLGFD